MTTFQPQDPHFAERVAASFHRQTVMFTLGAQLRHVTPGIVEIVLPYRADLCQQHGFMHAGMLTAAVDSACGYAALSLVSPEVGVLTVEFKVNFLAPAVGEEFIARGKVIGSGRSISVCTGEVAAVAQGSEKLVALMQATMMTVAGQEGIRD
jgi:uncharacterized protein (TIGR00369 family)